MRPSAILSSVVLAAAACTDVVVPPSAAAPARSPGPDAAAPPVLLTPITAGGVTHLVWPYTGVDFTAAAEDPVNLVFIGEADPRNLRAALMSASGNRGGTPFAAFDCTWKDAIGGIQTTYSEASGWVGSVIQMECGDYDPFRYHVRLFRAGDWTLGQAHVEILIPGTHDHAVLSWEVGEQFVMIDFMRTGLLGASPSQTGTINAAPSVKSIHPAIYNGLPPALRAIAGGPQENVAHPVPILTNGSATVLAIRERLPVVEEMRAYVVELSYDQTIPKPFCAAHEPMVHVQGPLRLRQAVSVSATGTLESRTFADGALTVTPVDPLTGRRGGTEPARIREDHSTHVGEHLSFAASMRHLRIHSTGMPQQLRTQLRVGPAGVTFFTREESC
jgi:hypothetical protein